MSDSRPLLLQHFVIARFKCREPALLFYKVHIIGLSDPFKLFLIRTYYNTGTLLGIRFLGGAVQYVDYPIVKKVDRTDSPRCVRTI